ncbi:DUF740 family protein [Quillaja saponaria]|uniref:DUF740 family protein n=1 Tax=Quillaja saponaria TaxID=32244 RepID=A0AAD7L880_QUISA|nr:DUF740 family protein [Quillaja saponaria]
MVNLSPSIKPILLKALPKRKPQRRKRKREKRTEVQKRKRKPLFLSPTTRTQQMALYVDEREIWKCPKHPSKRRRSGICPICLRERLVTLCPDCANVRPCSCCAITSCSSSSSSSSFSRFSFAGEGGAVGSIGRVSNLMDSEPAFRRSRSLAVPFLRSRSRFVGGDRDPDPESARDSPAASVRSSFWSLFKTQKSKRNGFQEEVLKKVEVEKHEDVIDRRPMMMRSKSVAVPAVAGSGVGDFRPPSKGKGWYFPSPIKVFRQTKLPKVIQQRSPMYRG